MLLRHDANPNCIDLARNTALDLAESSWPDSEIIKILQLNGALSGEQVLKQQLRNEEILKRLIAMEEKKVKSIKK